MNGKSFPLWERGLKYLPYQHFSVSLLSFPLWERGLKYSSLDCVQTITESFPLWERGLKSKILRVRVNSHAVVPLVGTWIEILYILD